MNYAYTILYVADVAASLRFFETAFGLQTRFLHESGAYGELETGATALAFARLDIARDSLGGDFIEAAISERPLGMEVGLACADVNAAFARALAAGATSLKPPTTKPWGQVVAYVRCPDGCLVELCTPMGG
ncbi:VOC family protein [Roseateles sp. DB2]|uniref:VOC family protein n=1 Tax=Roseateles sp. DB2 TaxID=3453717 RepID=UPI003EEA699C